MWFLRSAALNLPEPPCPLAQTGGLPAPRWPTTASTEPGKTARGDANSKPARLMPFSALGSMRRSLGGDHRLEPPTSGRALSPAGNPLAVGPGKPSRSGER